MKRAHVPIKVVLRTGAALLALWVASFALSYVPLGGAAIPVALAIALLKAVLVALFFMELLHESLSIKLTIVSAGVLTMTLIAFMVADIMTRAPPPLLVAPAARDAPPE